MAAVTAPAATRTPAFSYSVAAKARKPLAKPPSVPYETNVLPREPVATAFVPALLPMAQGIIRLLGEPTAADEPTKAEMRLASEATVTRPRRSESGSSILVARTTKVE